MFNLAIMDYFELLNRNRKKIELPEKFFESALKGQNVEGDEVIKILEDALKKQGIDVPPSFMKIAIFIAAKEYGMRTLDPDILQKAVLWIYNTSELMEFLRSDSNAMTIKSILGERQTVKEIMQMADEFEE